MRVTYHSGQTHLNSRSFLINTVALARCQGVRFRPAAVLTAFPRPTVSR